MGRGNPLSRHSPPLSVIRAEGLTPGGASSIYGAFGKTCFPGWCHHSYASSSHCLPKGPLTQLWGQAPISEEPPEGSGEGFSCQNNSEATSQKPLICRKTNTLEEASSKHSLPKRNLLNVCFLLNSQLRAAPPPERGIWTRRGITVDKGPPSQRCEHPGRSVRCETPTLS